MERHSGRCTTAAIARKAKATSGGAINASNTSYDNSSGGGGKKWSLRRLFRKKRESMCYSSSDEDRKAGFSPISRHIRNVGESGSKSSEVYNKSSECGRVVPAKRLPPSANIGDEYFLPVETVTGHEPYSQQQTARHNQLQTQSQQQLHSRSNNSLDRHAQSARMPKSRSVQRLQHYPGGHEDVPVPSEEELISLNSATFVKYQSDESIHNIVEGQTIQNVGVGGVGGGSQCRRSRASRNERYYKRRSRDGELSHGQAPLPPAPRWRTQPVVLQYQPQVQHNHFNSNSTLHHMDTTLQSRQLQSVLHDNKRSISYDSHINLRKAPPPLPPPRDPLRRVNCASVGRPPNGSVSDLRPLSCVISQSDSTPHGVGGVAAPRCVSDNKLWGTSEPRPRHKSFRPQNLQAYSNGQPCTNYPSSTNAVDIHYMADAMPRSRKPIHMFNERAPRDRPAEPPSSGILRTTKSGLPAAATQATATDFWQRLDRSDVNVDCLSNRSKEFVPRAKPRSISSSRVADSSRRFVAPFYQESSNRPLETDTVLGTLNGSLRIKTNQGKSSKVADNSKTCTVPSYNYRRSAELLAPCNKYEEYVTEKRARHHKHSLPSPVRLPPSPKVATAAEAAAASAAPVPHTHKVPANLEEAILELEDIYKSLGLADDPPSQRPEVTSAIARDFERLALSHMDNYDDDEDDSPRLEPDVQRDDVAYRSMQLANLPHKAMQKQPPFGIPVGLVVPAPQSDYLHVTPVTSMSQATNIPDVIKDDLAVRSLRKEVTAPLSREQKVHPSAMLQQQKKNRALRTQSANIYALIQRDAAKPAGGDPLSYLTLHEQCDHNRTASLTNLQKASSNGNSPKDVPNTLPLLRMLAEQDNQEQDRALTPLAKKSMLQIPFRHPSQGGAICSLPAVISSEKSVVTGSDNNNQLEAALNRIAKDAEESSIKLSVELQHLRNTALIADTEMEATAAAAEQRLALDLHEIESVSQAAKRCGEMLLETLPNDELTAGGQPRKLPTEDALMEAIDQVSVAANAVCEKILKDIVHVDTAVKKATITPSMPTATGSSTASETLIIPRLIRKLDATQSDNIEAIAERCMRQISVLSQTSGNDDGVAHTTHRNISAEPCNTHNNSVVVNSILSTLAETRPHSLKKLAVSTATTISNADVVIASSNATTTTSSSSDCIAKSSSPSASWQKSSSITSFNPLSSSDYVKSPSSECLAHSTDAIKTFSTTSYEVQSSSAATPNIHTHSSTFSYSPSPPVGNATPVVAQCYESSTRYDSTEELAMIFGIAGDTSIAPLNSDQPAVSHNQLEQKQAIIKSADAAQNNNSRTTELKSFSSPSPTSTAAQGYNYHSDSKSEKSTIPRKVVGRTRYSGYHPDFHHHVAAAFYRDPNSGNHTPTDVKRTPPINEKYISVYSTTPKLVDQQHKFPNQINSSDCEENKFPISSKEATTIELEDSQEPVNQLTSRKFQQLKYCKNISTVEDSNLKGDNNCSSSLIHSGSPEQSLSPKASLQILPLAPLPVVAPDFMSQSDSSVDHPPDRRSLHHNNNNSNNRSRAIQRFATNVNKRVVRVRSESRPISALYNIIYKERGIDVSSSSGSSDNDNKFQTSPILFDKEVSKSQYSNQKYERISFDARKKSLMNDMDGSIHKQHCHSHTNSPSSGIISTMRNINSTSPPTKRYSITDEIEVQKRRNNGSTSSSNRVVSYNDRHSSMMQCTALSLSPTVHHTTDSRLSYNHKKSPQKADDFTTAIIDQNERVSYLVTPTKLYVEPVNMFFNDTRSSRETNSNRNTKNQKSTRNDKRRHTDGLLNMLPRSSSPILIPRTETDEKESNNAFPSWKESHTSAENSVVIENANQKLTSTNANVTPNSTAISEDAESQIYETCGNKFAPKAMTLIAGQAEALQQQTSTLSQHTSSTDVNSTSSHLKDVFSMSPLSFSPHSEVSPAKLLVPSLHVLMEQNLNDIHFKGVTAPSSPLTCHQHAQISEPKIILRGSPKEPLAEYQEMLSEGDQMRPRSSTMQNENNSITQNKKSPSSDSSRRKQLLERDKSSKRKSHLNRSQTDEPICNVDNSIATRRRQRRELGLSRPLLPPEVPALRDIINPPQKAVIEHTKSCSPSQNLKTYHVDSTHRVDKHEVEPDNKLNVILASTNCRTSRRRDTLPFGDGKERKHHSNYVNRKLNERTKSDLAEIVMIAEKVNSEKSSDNGVIPPVVQALEDMVVAPSTTNVVNDLTSSINRIRLSHERELPPAALKQVASIDAAVKVMDDKLVPNDDEYHSNGIKVTSGKFSPILLRRDAEDSLVSMLNSGGGVSGALAAATHSHIVSILKKNYSLAGESTSTSSNASPVTFSRHVPNSPRNKTRAYTGILKKRSSLDESRYYSRSHSPDERSTFIKSARRNSLEENVGTETSACGDGNGLHQHSILKQQSSYDSCKSDKCIGGYPLITEPPPPGILKKKDSTSTPSDGGTNVAKHVSISQAVSLAAAELDNESLKSDLGSVPCSSGGDEIRPILKLDSTASDDTMRAPKPILKKKTSGDSDEHEIRPILKTSRKSSREECDSICTSPCEEAALELGVRSILKSESMRKRRSLGSDDATSNAESSSYLTNFPQLLNRRTRSLDRQQETQAYDLATALNAITTSNTDVTKFVPHAKINKNYAVRACSEGNTFSVAERIRNMEIFLTANSESMLSNKSCKSPPLLPINASLRNFSINEVGAMCTKPISKATILHREGHRNRYKTQPITNDEKNYFKSTLLPIDTFAADILQTSGNSAVQKEYNYEPYVLQYNTENSSNNHKHAALNKDDNSVILSKSAVSIRTVTQPIHCHHKQLHLSANDTLKIDPSISQSGISNSSIITEDYTHSIGDYSDRIFEMSDIEHDITMHDEKSTCAEKPNSSVLKRQGSVRTHVDMFQQFHERMTSREEPMSPGQELSSTTPDTLTNDQPIAENLKKSIEATLATAQQTMNSDEEFEPTLLSVSERLRIFKCMSEMAARNSISSCSSIRSSVSHNGCSSYKSIDCSHISSSSTNILASPTHHLSNMTIGSFDSITPTPMLADVEEKKFLPTSESIVLSRSSSQASDRASTLPRSTVKRSSTIRRTDSDSVGKLVLPSTFLHCDANNNRTNNVRKFDETNDSNDVRITVTQRIGKIKSCFIGSYQEEQSQNEPPLAKCKRHSSIENRENIDKGATLNDSSRDNAAAISDNVDVNGMRSGANASAVVEMRNKFIRMASVASAFTSVKLDRPVDNKDRDSITRSSSYVDTKFAKFFGLSAAEDSDGSDMKNIQNESFPSAPPPLRIRNSTQFAEQYFGPPAKDWMHSPLYSTKYANTINSPIINSISEAGGNDRFNTTPTFGAELKSHSSALSAHQTPPTNVTAVNEYVRLDKVKTPRLYASTPSTIPNDLIITTEPTEPTYTITESIMRNSSEEGAVFKNSRAYTPTQHTRVQMKIRTLTSAFEVPLAQHTSNVKRFEDIAVTKAELQSASNDFERILLSMS